MWVKTLTKLRRVFATQLSNFGPLEIVLVVTIVTSLGWLSAFSYNHHQVPKSINNIDKVASPLASDSQPVDNLPSDYREEYQKRNASSDPKPDRAAALQSPNFLIDELGAVPGLAKLIDDGDVRMILNFSAKNPEDLFSNESLSVQVRMINAASKVVLAVTACLKAPAACGVEDLNTDFMTMGAHPLHLILERALMIEKLGESGHLVEAEALTIAQLTDVLSVQQHNVAVLTVDLLTSRQLTSGDLQQVWDKGASVKGHAKVLYFKMLGDYLQSDENAKMVSSSTREGFIRELDRTLANRADAWTAVKVVSSIENFKLTSSEFKKVARRACDIPLWATEDDSRARLLGNVESQARRLNFCLETREGSTCDKNKSVALTASNYCKIRPI